MLHFDPVQSKTCTKVSEGERNTESKRMREETWIERDRAGERERA